MGRYIHSWIQDLFHGLTFRCPDGTEWDIEEKISEKSHVDSIGLGEAQAVYHCCQSLGPSVGLEAIVKIRMQVPAVYPASFDPEVRAREAHGWLGSATANEISTMKYLNKHGCSVVPRLLNLAILSQTTDDMPVPTGYMVMLVIEKCPGVTLVDFEKYSEEKKEKIRRTFRRDFTKLLQYHTYTADANASNIIYDEKEDRCWFIDHEHTFIREQENMEFSEYDYQEWGLEPWPYSPERKHEIDQAFFKQVEEKEAREKEAQEKEAQVKEAQEEADR
ncbi:uncharacterized protein GIQ15_02899 [Arthroderma uncinatum]|uniref:uncharacterized protein n=1 Tax=Arthroderma uncinatum TaxID=74035 RepID=UPI00144A58F8|nr:uncharacterized protein GIQ15_02899 [Arthroderma uncinatum]KAF3483575.1 hypothetical protein GIQ15_02899 [Arthroderma uncinatum]